MLRAQRLKLLGHLLRAPSDDLMKSVSFDPSMKFREIADKYRVGHPRDQWMARVSEDAFQLMYPALFPQLTSLPYDYPPSLLVLRSLAVDRDAWHALSHAVLSA